MRIIECRGLPRDLGREQGEILAPELHRLLASGRLRALADRLGWLDPETRRLALDLRRHFPHQAEWIEALARAARLPAPALVRALATRCGSRAPCGPVVLARTARELRLARALPRGALLRRVAPEGRFRSVELTFAEWSSALLGVNEAGLAVAVAPGRGDSGRFAPPTALFARDCLERFERVDAALEWCLLRPAGQGGALLLADATGDGGGVDCSGSGRKVLRPVDGWLALGGRGLFALEKPDAEPANGADLEAALSAALGSARGGEAVLADPRRRRLRVAGGESVGA